MRQKVHKLCPFSSNILFSQRGVINLISYAVFFAACRGLVRPRTCNSCSRDSPRLANRSQAKLATDGPGMSPKAFAAVTPCGRADAHSAHLSIHLTRGEALRQDTLRACCSIFLAKIMKQISCGSELIFISPTGGSIYKGRCAPRNRADKAINFLIVGQSWM